MNGNNLSNDEISEILIDYINDERKKQAVLLDGKWGSGKTYFMTEVFAKKFDDEIKGKKLIYISLYGKQNSKEIEDGIKDIMLEEYVNNKLNKLNNTRDQVKKISKFAYKIINEYAKSKDFDLENITSISEFINIGDAVIVFDDLERCCMNINEILGYINNLVEHDNVKVIIIANEEELGKIYNDSNLAMEYLVALKYNENKDTQDKKTTKDNLDKTTKDLFIKDSMYEKIKEKAIGLVIKYNVNFDDRYAELIKEEHIKNEKIRAFLEHKDVKQQVTKIFIEENKDSNLRTLIFALTAFEKFAETILNLEIKQEYKDEILKSVFIYCIYSSIKIKNGNIQYIEKITSNINNDDCEEEYIYYGINFVAIKAYKFVDKYLLYSYYNKSSVKKIIENISEEMKRLEEDRNKREEYSNLSFNTLKEWFYMEDEEIEQKLYILKEEIQEKRYEIGNFKNIIVTLLQLSNNGFDVNVQDYIELFKTIMNETTYNCKDEVLRIYTDEPKFGQEYNEMIKPLAQILNANSDKGKSADINEVFKEEENWGEKFEMYCNSKRNEIIEDKKFLCYLDIEKCTDMLKKSDVKNLYNFLYGIESVYSFSNLNEFFKNDISKIESLLNKIEEIRQLTNKKTRKLALSDIEDKLKRYLELIQR